MSKRTFICKNPVHGEDGSVWESKQTGDPSTIKCTKKGGRDGCGETQYTELYEVEKPKIMTGSKFKERMEKIRNKEVEEDKKIRSEVQKSKVLKNNMGFLFSDTMINLFHRSIIDFLETQWGMDIYYTPETEQELLLQAHEVLKMFTYEATPLQSYLMTWGILILPSFAKKLLGGLFGGDREENQDEKEDKDIPKNK